MQGQLDDIVYVDGIILTELTRPAASRASSNATYYALYFSQPDYWLPLEKTVCVGHLPDVSQAFEETARLKDALKPLSELSFACFPDCNAREPVLRIFIVFEDKVTAEAASKLLPDDSGELSPGELSESGLEVLAAQDLKEHLVRLRPLASVPVVVSVINKQIVLRIGSNGPGKYRKDFRWLLNSDIYHDPACADRVNEVSLVLDPDCEYRPVASGLPGAAGSREIDAVADMISDGILTMLSQRNTDLAITLAFHKGGSTHRLRSLLAVVNELDITDPNESHRDGRIDEYRPRSSKRYRPGTEREHHAGDGANRRASQNKGKGDRYCTEDGSVERDTPETSVDGSNNSELYLPELLNRGDSDCGSDDDLDTTDRRRRRQNRRGRNSEKEYPGGKQRTDSTGNSKAMKSIDSRMKVGNRQSTRQKKQGRVKLLPEPLGSGPGDKKNPEDSTLGAQEPPTAETYAGEFR